MENGIDPVLIQLNKSMDNSKFLLCKLILLLFFLVNPVDFIFNQFMKFMTNCTDKHRIYTIFHSGSILMATLINSLSKNGTRASTPHAAVDLLALRQS